MECSTEWFIIQHTTITHTHTHIQNTIRCGFLSMHWETQVMLMIRNSTNSACASIWYNQEAFWFMHEAHSIWYKALNKRSQHKTLICNFTYSTMKIIVSWHWYEVDIPHLKHTPFVMTICPLYAIWNIQPHTINLAAVWVWALQR